MPVKSQLKIGNKTIEVSNLDKVFYPKTGFTKGQLIDYYIRISPVLLPHLTRIFHKGINQRSGWSVHRLDFTKPNENATRRFFDNRL
ncbi:MAG TPA: hypothetical protein VMF08_21525 [Candidatus Sulfotelmatobacter sp.]|nr:hypothetical protein [Candidatus Sulfotelmatobacter sp.]